jgi:hypothetical protein
MQKYDQCIHPTKHPSRYIIVLILLASTTSCERGFSTQNHIESFGRYAMNISTLESLMRIALAKIPVDFLDFEDI